MTRAELAFAAACALAALAPLYPRGRAQPVAAPQPWAAVVEHSWQRTALSARDVSSGPLAIARFREAERRHLVRQLREPTRSLHSAADCLRAEGWEVQRTAAALADTRGAGVWVATRAGARIHVEEWVVDARGERFAELGEWYWSALFGRSQGPWVAYVLSWDLAARAPLRGGTRVSDP